MPTTPACSGTGAEKPKRHRKQSKTKRRRRHASGRQYINEYCLKYFQQTTTTPRGWYRGTVLDAKQTEDGKLEYNISYPNAEGQYSEWVSGEALGQAMEFWKDKKSTWVDPMEHQSQSSDSRVNVNSTSNGAPVVDDDPSDEDNWNVGDQVDYFSNEES